MKTILLTLSITLTLSYYAVSAADTNPSPACPSQNNGYTGNPISNYQASKQPECKGKYTWPILEQGTKTCCCQQKTSGTQYCIDWVKEANPSCSKNMTLEICDIPGRYCVCKQNVFGFMFCNYPSRTTTAAPTTAEQNNPHCYGQQNRKCCDTPNTQCTCIKGKTTKMKCTGEGPTTTVPLT